MQRWSGRSRSYLKALIVACAVLSVGAFAAVPGAAASPPPSFPGFSTGATDNITLYGNAVRGWGLDANNTTSPGPHLQVTLGDLVQLTLVSADGQTHNWFLDLANTSQPAGSEASSPDFGASNSVLWSFNATTPGTFTYRCKYHPGVMLGLITIAAPTHYTLYGDAIKGWGFRPTNITRPGPLLIVDAGANVTLTLYSADGAEHTWFIDSDNSSSVTGGEKQSPGFGGPGLPDPLNYSFVATNGGTYAYRCGLHPNYMWGMIVILGKPGAPAAAFPIPLIPGIMLAVIVAVLLLAAVYQIRATRAVRLKK